VEATNEYGGAYLYVETTPVGLPTPAYGPAAGVQAGEPARPRHAWISIEGGDVRYRLDGSEVVEPFGVLALDGEVIDWTEPLTDFSAFIANASFIATNGVGPVLLNISYRT
jgi:hypothetical protein